MKKLIKGIMFLIVIVLLGGCGEKTAITKEIFTKTLAKEGFVVSDVTDVMEDNDIIHVSSANNQKMQIEFYIFKEEKEAKKAFDTNVDYFENNKTKGKYQSKASYEKYTQKLSDTYSVIARVDNTLLYSSINIEYKNDLNKIIKQLNY